MDDNMHDNETFDTADRVASRVRNHWMQGNRSSAAAEFQKATPPIRVFAAAFLAMRMERSVYVSDKEMFDGIDFLLNHHTDDTNGGSQ